jgi:hypothetical protein
MGEAMIEQLRVAVRAWAIPERRHRRGKKSGPGEEVWRDRGPSAWALIFDTETETWLSQRFRIGTYQVRRAGSLAFAGIFYDPEVLSRQEVDLIFAYSKANGLAAPVTREQFVEAVFWRYAVLRRALVIGHNLPYDIARIAIRHYPCGTGGERGSRKMRGGFTFVLCRDPAIRIQVKRISAHAAFIRLVIPDGRSPEQRNREKGGVAKNHRGYFVDTATVGAALLGERYSLSKLSELLQTTHRKEETEEHGGPITRAYLRYAMGDPQATYECFEVLADWYADLGLSGTPIHWIASEAGIGKAYFREMGLRPWRALQKAPDWLMAAIMETYYGGRTECHVRLLATPGTIVDFASEYPTSFVLQDLWPFHRARGITWEREPVDRVRGLLATVTVEDVLRPWFWRGLNALVLLAPEDDRLPTRSQYEETKAQGRTRPPSLNMAVQRRSGGVPEWKTLADAVCSKLETDKPPHVLKVIRFHAKPAQGGLHAVKLGDRIVDPAHNDFIKALVQARIAVKKARDAEAEGSIARTRLDAIQRGMKNAANSSAYGTPIEMNVGEYSRRVWSRVYLPSGGSYRAKVERVEDPGTWFHPLVATLVAAGGRLLLATAMRLVRDAGGTYAICDTDSLFVVSTAKGGPMSLAERQSIHALSFHEVDEIGARFGALNPYDRSVIPGSILEVESENVDPTGGRRVVLCLSIASKRYCLFVLGPDGKPVVLRPSEHGLGHLVPPTGDENQDWRREWWVHAVCAVLGIRHPEPDWFADPAIGRLTVTSPHEEESFRSLNEGLPYVDRVRPWNFVMTAHPDWRERRRGIGLLVAPLKKNRKERRNVTWVDRSNPNTGKLRARTGNAEYVIPGTVVVQTYREYFEEYLMHAESKALGPNGRACGPWTRGVLAPRHIAAAGELQRIGKEVNRLADHADLSDGRIVEYPAPACRGCGKAISQHRKWCSDACRKRGARKKGIRVCGACGHPLSGRQRHWCSERCRKKASRWGSSH